MNKGPILILSLTQGQGGGAEAALRRLLRRLLSCCEPSEFLIASPEDSSLHRFSESAGLPWRAWAAKRDSFPRNLRAFLELQTAIGSLGPRLCIAWGARSFEWCALLRLRGSVGRIGRLADHPHSYYHGRTRQRLMRWSAHRMRCCIVPSQALRKVCQEAAWRVPLEVIYNLMDPMPPRQPGQGPLVEVGFLGGQSRLKGVDIVADWAEQLRGLPVRWHVFGDVSEPTDPALARIRRASERLQLHGRRPPSEIYRLTDLVVHPSQQFDSSPNVLLEAASAGVPVVASSIGGSAEFVVHGETGFLFEGSQAKVGAGYLEQLIRDTAMRHRMGSAAAQFFRRFMGANEALTSYCRLWNLDPAAPPAPPVLSPGDLKGLQSGQARRDGFPG